MKTPLRTLFTIAVFTFGFASVVTAGDASKTMNLNTPEEYEQELTKAVERIRDAEKRIETRIQELEKEKAELVEMRKRLRASRKEARAHLKSVQNSDDGTWEDIKHQVDEWINDVTDNG